MKKKSYDFNNAATKIQSWYRMVLVENMLWLAKARFSSVCTAIDESLAYPGYRFVDRIDSIIIGAEGRGEGRLHHPLFLPCSLQVRRAAAKPFHAAEDSADKKIDVLPTDNQGGDEGKTRGVHEILYNNDGAPTNDDNRDTQLATDVYVKATDFDRSQLEALSSCSQRVTADASYLSNLLNEQRWIESAIIERIKELRSFIK
jgi:hypothetical protein